MVYPIRNSSNEALQEAIFSYLNLNRHRFDGRGNLEATPNERDYVPRELIRFDFVPGNLIGQVPEMARKRRPASPFVEPETWDDENERNESYHRKARKMRWKYDSEKCADLYAQEKRRCRDRWTAYPYSEWFPNAYGDCIARAKARYEWCTNKKEMPEHLLEFGGYDASGQPVGKDDPDRKRDPQTPPPPRPKEDPDKSKRVTATQMSVAPYVLQPWWWAYQFATHPELGNALGDAYAKRARALLEKLVVPPSAYPKNMAPQNPFSPPPALLPAFGMP